MNICLVLRCNDKMVANINIDIDAIPRIGEIISFEDVSKSCRFDFPKLQEFEPNKGFLLWKVTNVIYRIEPTCKGFQGSCFQTTIFLEKYEELKQ